MLNNWTYTTDTRGKTDCDRWIGSGEHGDPVAAVIAWDGEHIAICDRCDSEYRLDLAEAEVSRRLDF